MIAYWLRRRWIEFCMGHTHYLYFLFGFSNFVLIAYNFGLDAIGAGRPIGLPVFAVLVIAVYAPAAVLVGSVTYFSGGGPGGVMPMRRIYLVGASSFCRRSDIS